MYLRHQLITIATLMVILAMGNSFAFAQVVDGPIARKHLERQVRNLLYQDKFDELEKMAKDFRSTKAKFPDGAWKLQFYYEGFSAPKDKSQQFPMSQL